MESSAVETLPSVVEDGEATAPPTNSMVTVRLSDERIEPPQVTLGCDPKRRSSSVASRSSIASAGSDTGSSSPSNTSVDWEILEKTEEQEPKDEGTDEVYLFEYHRGSWSLTRLVDHPPFSQAGARKCCFGGQPEGWTCSHESASKWNTTSVYTIPEKTCQWSSATKSEILAFACATDD